MPRNESSCRKEVVKCINCNEDFNPHVPSQVYCSQPSCQSVRKKKFYKERYQKRKEELGIQDKNKWTDAEIHILETGRHLSRSEIAELIDRNETAIAAMRSKLKLTMIGYCRTCGCEYDIINQQPYCKTCLPTEKEYAKIYRNSIRGKWQQYKGNAKKRNIEYLLTKDDIKKLWQKPCTYCGSEIETVGIDRVDNSKPYTKDNIVSCCGRCNEMKMAATKEDWIESMKKVLHHLGEQL